MRRAFRQVDVFTSEPMRGNPVAVVLDGDGLDTTTMQRFAHWTNLSETTFVLPPTDPNADYRVRIFTPTQELPFAGHPTLGTCHAWLEAGGIPSEPGHITQQCASGLIAITHDAGRLAFAAPPLIRSGPVDDETFERVVRQLGISRDDVMDAAWAVNGPHWVAVLLADAAAVLALRPGPIDLDIGVVGFHPAGSDHAIEVRAFFEKEGVTTEDPVTGSLNAGVAMWLRDTERLSPPYVAAQGTALGRAGRVHVTADEAGRIWVGGDTVTCVEGTVDLE